MKTFRKRFVVVNRNNSEKNHAAIEAMIVRYEKKTGYTVSREGMTAGNKMFKYEAFADVTTNN